MVGQKKLRKRDAEKAFQKSLKHCYFYFLQKILAAPIDPYTTLPPRPRSHGGLTLAVIVSPSNKEEQLVSTCHALNTCLVLCICHISFKTLLGTE